MATLGVGLLKGWSSVSSNTSPLFGGHIGLLHQALSRPHSHSVLSGKRVIPKPPKQPREKYDIDYNPPGALQGWADWAMKKDHRKRGIVMEWGCERKLVNTIRRNRILPKEIQEIADKEIVTLPKESSHLKVMHRCAISSRPSGVVYRWRLSRHFFRHFADYNKLAGVQRGIW